MINRIGIVETARTWLGTPYLHQASVKNIGSDCLGLIRGVGAELGYLPANLPQIDPRVVGYGSHPYGLMVPLMKEYLDEADRNNPQIGSVLIFRIRDEPQHCAIVSDIKPDGTIYMIHAYQTHPFVVECLIADLWQKRITHIFDYRG